MAARVPSLPDELRRPLVVVAGLAALFCLTAFGAGGFFLFRPAQEPEAAVRVATDAFVRRLVAGNFDGAYDQLCVDTRERFERGEFVAGVGGRPAVRSYQIDRIEREGSAYAVYLTLADPGGAGEAHVFRVVDDRGTWRICGDPLPA